LKFSGARPLVERVRGKPPTLRMTPWEKAALRFP
jgi:hypothetical protein